ncbi:MAG: hypothetical protein KBG15_16000 [Kofleriaceae bacterium]|nr:hypothetical protein [Kofleriaceae bacterium]
MEIPPTLHCRCARAATLLAAVALTALTAGCDDTKAVDGARTGCAVGGALNGCQAPAATVIDACNRLVDCGSIPVDNEDENGFDWGRCVDQLESRQVDQQRFTISCIVASACDELRTDGSPNNPYGRIACLAFGQR